MATVTKDFRIKSGLVVEGATGTINGEDIITTGNNTDDLAEGSTNQYYTESRAKTDAAELLTGATLTNITITGDGDGLTITAENGGIQDLTGFDTDDLTEGTSNLYFTNERAQAAGVEVFDAYGSANLVAGDLETHTQATSAHGVTGDIVGTTDEQTLTNKTITDKLKFSTSGDLYIRENSLGGILDIKNDFGGINIGSSDGRINISSFNSDVRINQTLIVDGTTGSAYYGSTTPGSEHEIATVGYADTAAETAESNANDYTDTAIGNISTNLDIAGDTGTDSITLGSDTFTITGGTGITTSVASNAVTVDIDSTVATLEGTQQLKNKSLDNATIIGGLNANSNKITNLATPTATDDAATKGYVDGAISGLDWKPAVNLLSTVNIPNLNDAAATVTTIDGHAWGVSQAGYRVLLTGQTTATQNGIYLASESSGKVVLTRSDDSDTYQELVGAAVFVMEGTTYGSTSWVQSNHYLTDFSSQNWTQFSGQGTYTAGNGLEIDGNEFAIDDTVVVTHDDLDGYLNSTDGTTYVALTDYVDTAIETGDATATPTYLALDINSVAKQVASQTLVIDTGSSVLYSYSMANRGGKFIVVLQDTSSGHTQVSEILVTNDTAGNIAITEYAIVTTNGQLGDVDAVANGSDIEVTITGLATGTIVARAHGTIILS